MTMAAGVCFSYRVAPGGPLLFGQLGPTRLDGSWSFQPLLSAETAAAALLPLQQNHEDMAALDSDIWLIPLLVADKRVTGSRQRGRLQARAGVQRALLSPSVRSIPEWDDWCLQGCPSLR
jgi:hypothetical protein